MATFFAFYFIQFHRMIIGISICLNISSYFFVRMKLTKKEIIFIQNPKNIKEKERGITKIRLQKKLDYYNSEDFKKDLGLLVDRGLMEDLNLFYIMDLTFKQLPADIAIEYIERWKKVFNKHNLKVVNRTLRKMPEFFHKRLNGIEKLTGLFKQKELAIILSNQNEKIKTKLKMKVLLERKKDADRRYIEENDLKKKIFENAKKIGGSFSVEKLIFVIKQDNKRTSEFAIRELITLFSHRGIFLRETMKKKEFINQCWKKILKKEYRLKWKRRLIGKNPKYFRSIDRFEFYPLNKKIRNDSKLKINPYYTSIKF